VNQWDTAAIYLNDTDVLHVIHDQQVLCTNFSRKIHIT